MIVMSGELITRAVVTLHGLGTDTADDVRLVNDCRCRVATRPYDPGHGTQSFQAA